MKRIIKPLIIVAILIAAVLSVIYLPSESKELPKILISQVIDHQALNKTTQGIIDALDQGGYESGQNIEIRKESAQGNAVLAGQIASKFKSDDDNPSQSLCKLNATIIL